MQQGPARHPEGAQPVEDGSVEAGSLGEGRVRVQGIAVTREPVQQRLVGAGGVAHDVVGVPRGRLVAGAGRAALAPEPALAADEESRARAEPRLARLAVH